MDSEIVDFLYQAQSEVFEASTDSDADPNGPMGSTLVALARIPLRRANKTERRVSSDRAAWRASRAS